MISLLKSKKYIHIGIIIILIIIFDNYINSRNEENILNNYDITIGQIVDYSISGDADNRILVYNYVVEKKVYSRKISPSKYYDNCYYDKQKCFDKKFHVIYSKKYPEYSLIDISKEINIIDSNYVKNNLERFE